MLSKQFCVITTLLVGLLALVQAQSFEGNQILNGLTVFVLPVLIAQNSNLIIHSGLIHQFFLSLTNHGGLYICETKSFHIGMTITHLGNIFNYGTYVIDDSAALTGLIYENLGVEFYNGGEYFLVGKKPLITGSHYRIWALTFHNEGLMGFYQSGTSDFLTAVELGPQTFNDLLHIWNDGTICLRAVNLHARVAFEGTGCIDVGAYATFTVNNLITRPVKSQTVYMSDETSEVYVKSLLGLSSLTVRGWGNNNNIFFGITITTYTYNTGSGILTIIDGLNLINIDIGTGYDQSKMFRTTGHLLIGSGLTYSDAAPDASRPSNCAECIDAPSCDSVVDASFKAVENSFTETGIPAPYTATYTTEGSTITEIHSFFQTTDSNGSVMPAQTLYTLLAN